jgi:hypothetical protein
LVVEGPSHPTLQVGPRIFLGGLDRIQIAKSWRTKNEARRYDWHQVVHRAATQQLYRPDGGAMIAARTELQEFTVLHHPEVRIPALNHTFKGFRSKDS